MNKRLKKLKLDQDRILNQDDYAVYAVKIYSERNSKVESTFKTIEFVLLNLNWTTKDSYYPMMVAKTHITKGYDNNAFWRSTVKLLEDDCVVEISSTEYEIYIKELATIKDDLLIDADTPFQVRDIHYLDNHNHTELFNYFKRIDNAWEKAHLDVIDLNKYIEINRVLGLKR